MLVYIVKLHYNKYIFTDRYDALCFAEEAVISSESGETVEIEIKEENWKEKE